MELALRYRQQILNEQVMALNTEEAVIAGKVEMLNANIRMALTPVMEAMLEAPEAHPELSRAVREYDHGYVLNAAIRSALLYYGPALWKVLETGMIDNFVRQLGEEHASAASAHRVKLTSQLTNRTLDAVGIQHGLGATTSDTRNIAARLLQPPHDASTRISRALQEALMEIGQDVFDRMLKGATELPANTDPYVQRALDHHQSKLQPNEALWDMLRAHFAPATEGDMQDFLALYRKKMFTPRQALLYRMGLFMELYRDFAANGSLLNEPHYEGREFPLLMGATADAASAYDPEKEPEQFFAGKRLISCSIRHRLTDELMGAVFLSTDPYGEGMGAEAEMLLGDQPFAVRFGMYLPIRKIARYLPGLTSIRAVYFQNIRGKVLHDYKVPGFGPQTPKSLPEPMYYSLSNLACDRFLVVSGLGVSKVKEPGEPHPASIRRRIKAPDDGPDEDVGFDVTWSERSGPGPVVVENITNGMHGLLKANGIDPKVLERLENEYMQYGF